MVHLLGPKGCILSCPHLGGPQAFSEVYIPRAGFSVHGAPVWPSTLTEGIHKGSGSSPNPSSSGAAEDPT